MNNWPRGIFEVNEPRIKGKLNFVLTDGEHVYISAGKLFELEATDLIVKIGSNSVSLNVGIHLYFKDGGWRFGDVAKAAFFPYGKSDQGNGQGSMGVFRNAASSVCRGGCRQDEPGGKGQGRACQATGATNGERAGVSED
jgi:hypothetical protein